MGEISLTYKDVAFFLIGINILLGILFGLFPLIVGKKFGNGKFGTIGFFASLIGGGLLGIIASFPAAFIFTWYILRSPQASAPETVSSEAESPAES